MRRDLRKQPWQTFPFWFLMLSGLALTMAWKLDLLRPKRDAVAVDEAVEAEADQSPDWASEPAEDESITAVSEQAEPVVEEEVETPRSFPAEGSADTAISQTTEDAPAQTIPEQADSTSDSRNPFSRSQVRITPVSGSRSIPSAKVDPAASTGSRNPFGPTTTEIRGNRSGFQVAEPAENTGFDANSAPDAKTSNEIRTASIDSPAEPKSESIAPAAKAPNSTEAVDLTEIDRLIEDGEDVEANFQLSNLYWKRPETRPQLIQRLRAVAYRIYFAPQPHYMDGHVVQPGDVLQNISKDYNVSWEYLAKLNRTEAKKIRPGQKLKVIRGPFSAVVDLSDMEMTVHSHGHFVAQFPVGIGRDHSSPTGTFKVLEKLRDPTYYGPDGVIEHDDPKNPLGEYWIDLGEGIGIHGTIDQASIGKAESDGCIRLKDRDIADVFDLLTVGSEVLIKK